MIELYLDGRKADIQKDIDIAITYESIDTTSPEAIKNSFSKTVTLIGSRENNALFGEIYRLDRNIFESDNYRTISFDPRKRVGFELYNDGAIVDEGYFQLDSISRRGGVINYEITLYGSLGDFFYNLSVGEDGKELRLCDLKYGFANEESTILTWDKDYIRSSWNRLSSTYSPYDIKQNITAVPTYSGNYDDFDNEKIFVNYSGLNAESKTVWGEEIAEQDATGTPRNGFAIVEAGRDLDEWETRDLRSVYQRPAIKLSKVFEAIADPENNGGFNVALHKSILESPYYKDTFILQKRIDLEETDTSQASSFGFNTEVTSDSDIELIGISNSGILNLDGQYSRRCSILHKTFFLSGEGGVTDFELTDEVINLGKYSAVINIDISGVPTDRNLAVFRTVQVDKKIGPELPDKNTAFFADILSGYFFEFEYMTGSTVLATKYYYIYSDKDGLLDTAKHNVADFKAAIDTYAGGSVVMLNLGNARSTEGTNRIIWEYAEDLIPVLSGCSAGDRLKIRATIENPSFFGVTRYHEGQYLIPTKGIIKQGFDDVIIWAGDSNRDTYYNGRDKISVDITTSEYIEAGFTIDSNTAGQSIPCTKEMLINTEKSPFDFLVGFTKMLNLKYLYDKGSKTINILPMRKYYKDEIINVEEKIDRGKDFTITPHVAETQYYKYCLPTPETYASELYKKKTGKDYAEHILNTGYNFVRDVEDVLEDNFFTNLVPFRLSSIFMTDVKKNGYIMPTGTICPSFTLHMWNTVTGQEMTAVKAGLGSNAINPIAKTFDNYPKLCCFDEDDNLVDDATDSLVFFTGYENVEGRHYLLSDNLKYMLDLNGGNYCHLYTDTTSYSSPYASDSGRVAKLDRIPLFGKYKMGTDGTYEYTLDMGMPLMSFCNDIQRFKEDRNIYAIHFRKPIDDIYHKDAKSVEVDMFLKDNPTEALRKFYYFDGSMWLLSKIEDYSPMDKLPSKCTFVKVNDRAAYFIPEEDETTTTTTEEPVPTSTTTTTTTTTTPAP